MAELTDQEKIRLGAQRMLALRERVGERRANLFLVELGDRIAAHGRNPRSDVIMHVVGNVSDAEWKAAIARIPE